MPRAGARERCELPSAKAILARDKSVQQQNKRAAQRRSYFRSLYADDKDDAEADDEDGYDPYRKYKSTDGTWLPAVILVTVLCRSFGWNVTAVRNRLAIVDNLDRTVGIHPPCRELKNPPS